MWKREGDCERAGALWMGGCALHVDVCTGGLFGYCSSSCFRVIVQVR